MAAQADDERTPTREVLARLARASRGFWLVNWVNFGDGIAYFGVLGLMTLFLEHDVGLSSAGATIATSAFTGLVTLFMILGAGALSDRLGARRALGAAMAIVLVGRIILTLSPSTGGAAVYVAWIAIVLMGFAEGALQPALYAGVKQYTDERTAAMGYAFLYAIMNLGIFMGEIVSPWIRESFAHHVEGVDVGDVPTAGITGSFWFFTIVTAVVLAVHLGLFTRRVEDCAQPAPPEPARTLVEKLRALPVGDARFLAFIFVLLPVRTLFAHQWLTMPAYITRSFPAEIGARVEWIQSLNPIVIVVAVPALAALTRRFRVVDVMIVGTLVSAAATFLLVGPPSLAMLITYTIVFTIGEAIWSSRFFEHVANLAPAGRTGVYMGIAGLPWFLAKTVTGLYAGTMIDAFVPEGGGGSPGTLWLIHGAIAMISPVGLVLARRWLLAQKRVDAPAAPTSEAA